MNLELITDYSYFFDVRLSVIGEYSPAVRCSECNMESDIMVNTEDQLADALNKEGWRQDDFGNCYCPRCANLAKHW